MIVDRESFTLNITPNIVSRKINQYKHLEVPDGYVFVVASTDINPSYCLTTTILAFRPDTTCIVIDHRFTKIKIRGDLNDSEFNAQLYQKLSDLGRELNSLGLNINAWVIDGSGRQFDAVTGFSKNSMQLTGLQACAFLGRSETQFNPYVRSKLREAVNSVVLCGDEAEHKQYGNGIKYCFWNADKYKMAVHKALLSEIGAQGSLTLFKDDSPERTDFCIQVCNEKLHGVRHCSNGRDIYEWKTKEPHDCLDTLAQAFAIAAFQGISANNQIKRSINLRPMKRRRIRIV